MKKSFVFKGFRNFSTDFGWSDATTWGMEETAYPEEVREYDRSHEGTEEQQFLFKGTREAAENLLAQLNQEGEADYIPYEREG